MSRRLITLAAALVLEAATLVSQGRTQEPPTTFRVAVDLVAVDVQVIDRDGRPVAGLGPDKFEVTINGGRRRVVTAELIETRAPDVATHPPAADASARTSPASLTATAPPRVIVLAVDGISFDPGASRSAMQAARDFIKRLPAEDLLGLFAYPAGPKVDPTIDHDAIIRALDAVVGQRETTALSKFHLRPSEIIDLTTGGGAGGGRSNAALEAIVKRECGDPVEDSCRSQVTQAVMFEVQSMVLSFEGQANASLGMLRSLLKEMGTVPGRKTLVLVSGGMIASDSPGGRPDINDMGIQIGREAARANTAIYTLYFDSGLLERNAAETRKAANSAGSLERDSTILGRWLEQFSGTAGGALFRIQAGTGEPAFNRILAETSSYYLLGVEPAEADRDGRTHEIKVKTSQRNVTVRGRRWVAVPKRGEIASGAKAAALPNTPGPSTPPPASGPKPRVVAPQVQALADLFDRKDYDALQRGLGQTKDLANLLIAFRRSDSPWPNAPRRAAVFALEMAVAGLRSNNGYARDEGARLLAQYNTLVRQPAGADAFECSWLWAEVAALEGVFMPDSAMLFVPRALERCPTEPRFQLAHAVLTELQWLRGATRDLEETEVTRRYEAAMTFPETASEARVRAAWFLHRLGRSDRALAMLDGVPGQPTDRHVRYLADLVRGQVLRSLGRSDDAAAAFRAALATWPGAQSARVALMTLLVSRGDREDAAALAQAAETAPDDQFDPWWTYWLGDYREYPAIIARLRELGR